MKRNPARLWTISLAAFIFCGLFPHTPARGQTSANSQPGAIVSLATRYAGLRIDSKGFIVSLTGRQSGKEYSPAGHSSPLLSLHEYGQPYSQLIFPVAATYYPQYQEVALKYPNGATAVVKIACKDAYFRFQLASLTPRGNVDNIVWGPLHTTISKTIGDLIGVVRDNDWAIGLYGLDDNTIAGPPVDGDCYQMGYYIHSPDPAKYPLPPQYKEGQRFSVGGNGVSDVAFYSHPELYFHYIVGNGAILEPEFGSTLAYHSRDRRRSYVHFYSLLTGFAEYGPRHQVSDPVPGVDFIGSAVALYACPDDQGLATIEKIELAEGLPHITIDGKWIRDPSTIGVTLYWSGLYDKCIEYAEALGVKDITRDTGEFYPSRGNNWSADNIGFANRPPMSFKEFTEEAHQHGLSHGGLHTLCLFLQGGISIDVTPVPSEHLQTVCRTTLAKDISPTDTDIVVTDPSYLGEKGTWPMGNDSNFLRIGGEMLRYEGITDKPPYTLLGVKRGHATKATAHKAGEELVKLQENCYHGFAPDMKLLLDYADYYADLMARNGMDMIDFDGFESTIYQNQGYYGVRVFCRRLFETYAKLTGGKVPRVTSSCVFPGSWEYIYVFNVGGGDRGFNPVTGRFGIEGKDWSAALSSSYYSATLGSQGWQSDWSLYDAENLQAKAVGWDAGYDLLASQDVIDRSGERDAIFKAFRTWNEARAAGLFTKAQKEQLRDPDYKFHLEQNGPSSFVLYPVKEIRTSGSVYLSAPKQTTIGNPYDAQALQFVLRANGPFTNGVIITLPNGSQIKSDKKMEAGQFIICKGNQAYLADHYRNKLTDLEMDMPASLPQGESKINVQLPEGGVQTSFDLIVWASGKGERLEK